jgi:hypothetical protein
VSSGALSSLPGSSELGFPNKCLFAGYRDTSTERDTRHTQTDRKTDREKHTYPPFLSLFLHLRTSALAQTFVFQAARQKAISLA